MVNDSCPHIYSITETREAKLIYTGIIERLYEEGWINRSGGKVNGERLKKKKETTTTAIHIHTKYPTKNKNKQK